MEKRGRGRGRGQGTSKGKSVKKTSRPGLQHLEQKAEELVKLFTSLSPTQQLNGLDVFQNTVNEALKAVTQGRVSSVKFVPIEHQDARNAEANPHPRGLTDLATSDHTDKLTDTIKEEHETGDWPVGPKVSIVTTTAQDGATVVQLCQQGAEARQEADRGLDVVVKEEPDKSEESSSGEEEDDDDDDTDEYDVPNTANTTKGRSTSGDTSTKSPTGSKKGPSLFQCPQCSYSTPKKSNLSTHMITHSGNRDFKCLLCGKLFTAASSLKRHIQAHDGVKPFQCPVCSKCFIDQASLRTHSVVHTGERMYKCDQCSKQYTNSANLSRHRRVHTGEMPYICHEAGCDARFRDLSSLKLHTLKHTGEKPYLCEVCNKQFKTSSDFKRHERIHTGERNYECEECGRKFIQGWHLKQHQRMHADLRPWPCTKCGKHLRTKSSLQHHMRSHAGIKDFHCPICKKAFSTKKYLRDHQVVHTSAKPYKCATCGQDFNQVSNLKRHERIHSDVCRYKCRHCDKAFKYINSWRYHEGIHTGEMMTCAKCGLAFRSIHGIKNHQCQPEKYEENVKRNQSKRKSKEKSSSVADPEIEENEVISVIGHARIKEEPENDEYIKVECEANILTHVKEEPMNDEVECEAKTSARKSLIQSSDVTSGKPKPKAKLNALKKLPAKLSKPLSKLVPLKVKINLGTGIGAKLPSKTAVKRKNAARSSGNNKKVKDVGNSVKTGEDVSKVTVLNVPNGRLTEAGEGVKPQGAGNSWNNEGVVVIKKEHDNQTLVNGLPVPGTSEGSSNFSCEIKSEGPSTTPSLHSASNGVSPEEADSEDDVPLSDLSRPGDPLPESTHTTPPADSVVATGSGNGVEGEDIEVGDLSDSISNALLRPPVRNEDSEDTFPQDELPPSLRVFSAHSIEDDLGMESSSSSSSEDQPQELTGPGLGLRFAPSNSQSSYINSTDQEVPT